MQTCQFDATVIILGYNGLGYVDRCLGSVLDQDFPAEKYEVIWADNGSTDGSAEYVERQFPTVRVVQFDSNHGFAEGNNRAAKEARGRCLVFLNQDTIVHRGWLRALVGTLDAHDDIIACQANMLMPWHARFHSFDRIGYPDVVHFQEIDRYGCVVYRECPMQEAIIPSVFLAGASFIIDRRIVERMPYIFDPLLVTYSDDLDLSLRLRALGYHVAVAPRAVLYHLQYSKVSSYRSAVRKAYLTARNRILAHYKVMPGHHFVMFLPKLLWGGVLKIKHLHFGRMREILTMVAMLPTSAAALLGATRLMPRYRGYVRKMIAFHNQD
jgi:GT2 family glycosyltransferase